MRPHRRTHKHAHTHIPTVPLPAPHSPPDIDGLRRRRDDVSAAVEVAEAERCTLQAESASLARRIADLNEGLARKVCEKECERGR